jgi:UDP-N-acetylmuramoylalanine--D-glutamate ligase
MSTWQGRRVLVIGAARQGRALAAYLAAHGAEVVLNDRLPLSELQEVCSELEPLSVRIVAGGHPLDLLDHTDLVCISGGVPLNNPLVAGTLARGLPLSNDSQVFLELVPCPVIGITGSAGKTTTTTLVHRMAQTAALQGSFRRAWLGGNIGTPLIGVVDQMIPNDFCVVEFSSFQLEQMTISPHVAAVLNITPNHLDRHGTMEAYTAAKGRLLQFEPSTDVPCTALQGGCAAVLGRDDPGAWSLVPLVGNRRLFSFGLSALPEGQEGTYTDGEWVMLRIVDPASGGQEDFHLMPTRLVLLRGEHNLLNVLAACAIAAAAGFPRAVMQAGVEGFTGVAHRLQFVRSWGGADWYNDSIATAPERTLAAIRSFDEPLVLLLGGRDKNLPWGELAKVVHQRVDHVVLFGEAEEKIFQALQQVTPSQAGSPLTITRCSGLRQAVQSAAAIVQPGDVVLLSPGGTSFDEFHDFEERGLCFSEWVNQLV